MLLYSAPLVISGIAVWINLYFDRIMIKHFMSLNDVGLYSVGYRISSISILIMIGIKGALSPLVFRHYKKANTPIELEKLFRLFLSISLITYLILTLFSFDFLKLMTTPAYYGAGTVIIFLVPAILLGNMYIFFPGIVIEKKTNLILYINVCGAILNILLNYLLIPRFGIDGAAVASMISYFIIFIIYIFFGQRFYYIAHNWYKIIIASFIAFILVIIKPQISLYFNAQWSINLIIILFFLTILFHIGLINYKELSTYAKTLHLILFSKNRF